jgi:hypothetical protein
MVSLRLFSMDIKTSKVMADVDFRVRDCPAYQISDDGAVDEQFRSSRLKMCKHIHTISYYKFKSIAYCIVKLHDCVKKTNALKPRG